MTVADTCCRLDFDPAGKPGWIASLYPVDVIRWFQDQGIPVATWEYTESVDRSGFLGAHLPADQRYIGPMAQDVLRKHPLLVAAHDGTLIVNVAGCCAAAGTHYTGEIYWLREEDMTFEEKTEAPPPVEDRAATLAALIDTGAALPAAIEELPRPPRKPRKELPKSRIRIEKVMRDGRQISRIVPEPGYAIAWIDLTDGKDGRCIPVPALEPQWGRKKRTPRSKKDS